MGKIKKQYIYVVLIVVMMLVILGLIIVEASKGKTKGEAPHTLSEKLELPELEADTENVTVHIDTEMIQEELRRMSFLETEEYFFTQVERYEKEKKLIFGITSESSFIYSYDGTVTAGIDCKDIVVSGDEESGKLVIKIPSAQIHNVIVYGETFKRYEENSSMWNKLDLTDFNNSRISFEESAKQNAIDKGVLEKADENAILIISNFANSIVNATGTSWKVEVIQ